MGRRPQAVALGRSGRSERGFSVGLALLLVAVVTLCALVFVASRGEDMTSLEPLGLLTPLALLAGFIGLYLREERRHPEMDHEDDRRHLRASVVLKFGCLLLFTASLAAVVLGLLFR